MSFYEILQNFHSGWAYLTLLMGVLFVLMVGYFAFSKKARTAGITKLSFFATLTFHIQLLVGVVLYFVSPYAQFTENTMKDATNRLYAIEHPLMMFAAVVLITVANAKLKKTDSVPMSSFILGLIALVLVLSRIPWSAWLG
jgi:hypothetical protein